MVPRAYGALVALGSFANAEEERAHVRTAYDFLPFENWDCVEVNGTLDWDGIYSQILEGFKVGENRRFPDFFLADPVYGKFYENAAQAYKECPLGSIYIILLYTYALLTQGAEQSTVVQQSDELIALLRLHPMFLVAGSRWPIFEAFHHFRDLHVSMASKAESLCTSGIGKTGIDWQHLQGVAIHWADEMLAGLEPGQGNKAHGVAIKDAVDRIARNPREMGDAAQDECPLGFLFLATTQAMASAMRLTGAMESWARAIDSILGDLPYYLIAGARWPTYQVLAMFSSHSKGVEANQALGSFQADIHRWAGAHPISKRFRAYGDLRLARNELAPFGIHGPAFARVQELVSANTHEWYANLAAWRQSQQLRQIYSSALDAALTTMRADTFPERNECGYSGISPESCIQRGCLWMTPKITQTAATLEPACQRASPARKVLLVTFVWGEKWARLVPRFIGWMNKLRVPAVIVAMGKACRTACQAAALALGGWGTGSVGCWDPYQNSKGPDDDHGSILQRHAMIHLMLHLGVDVVAFDFDTFLFADPRKRLEQIAENHDADILMTRHLDADCLNMGLIYVRASVDIARWYLEYLSWLHLHPYEREQRAVNSLLKYTQQKVSFPPKDMPRVKAVALDEVNEFASSRGGWMGDWQKIIFFHWVNPTVTRTYWSEVKITDIQALYEAGLHRGTDLAAFGWSLGRALGAAPEGSLLNSVRMVLEDHKVAELPQRQTCW